MQIVVAVYQILKKEFESAGLVHLRIKLLWCLAGTQQMLLWPYSYVPANTLYATG